MAEIASAFVTIAPSAKGFGSKLNSDVGSGVRSAGSSLGKTFGKLFVLGAGVIAAAGVGNLLKGSIDEAREAQKVGAQTNAVLKSTGGVAGVTADQVGKMAGRLSAVTGVDDEVIQSGENMLLTFTNVRNEVGGKFVGIFDQATITIQDMAAAFGGDATSNAKILGKALNDPVKGVSALTRVGVTFTDKQKDQIKTLVESGKTAKAQKIILGELAKETKGSAAAQATAGDKASVAMGNLKETIGTALLPVVDRLANFFTTKVAPAITTFIGQLKSGEGVGGRVANVFTTIAGAIGDFVGQMKAGTGPGGLLAGVLGTIGDVLGKLFTFIANNKTVVAAFVGSIYAIVVATAAWNAVLAINPLSLVVIGIAALIAGLVYAYKHSETFRKGVDALWAGVKVAFAGIKKIVTVVVGFIKDHWRLLIVILGGPIGIAVALITKHWDTIKAGAQVLIGWVKDHWPAIKAIVTGPFTAAQKVIGPIWTSLRQGAGRVKDVLVKVFNTIKDAIQAAIDKVQDLIDKLAKVQGKSGGVKHNYDPNATPSSRILTPDGAKMAEGLARGIASGSERVGQAVEKLGKKVKEKASKIRDALSSVKDDFASLVDPIASNFTQGLFDFTDAASFTANLTSVKGTLKTLLANFTKLKGEGLSAGFLYQLFQSGGPELINSLAGLSGADATNAASLFGDVTDLSQQLGTAVAGGTDKGAALETQTAVLSKKLDELIKHVDNSAHRTGAVINGAASSGYRKGRS